MLNWYVRKPPTSGVITATGRRVTASMTGQQPEFGPLQATAQKASCSMSGNVPLIGDMSISAKAVIASFIGEQKQQGGLAVTLLPPTISITQANFQGAIDVTALPTTSQLIGAQLPDGNISSSMAKTVANLLGSQELSGALAVTAKIAQSVMMGEQAQSGTMTAAVKKAVAKLVAPPEVIASNNATVASTRSWSTGTISGWTPQENDIVFIDIHSLQSTSLTYTIPSGWNIAVSTPSFKSSEPRSLILWHVVTAAEATAVTTSWTLTNVLDTSRQGRRIAWVVRGADTTSPIGANSSNGATATTVTINGITPIYNGSLIIAGWGGNSISTTTTYTMPSGWTVTNGTNSAANAVDLMAQNASLSPIVAGTPIATFTSAINRSDDFSSYLMEIKPAA